MKKCPRCNIVKDESEFPRYYYGWCIDCKNKYSRIYYKNHREKLSTYRRELRYKHGGKSMAENKECGPYLGCYINERILRHVMPNAVLMDNNNPGFDLVCGKGYLVDAKAATLRYRKTHSPRWEFNINKNTIPDYFLLVAYKDRESLEICHMWLIPGDEINDKKSVSIALSTIHKWDQWKINHTDALSCVTKMTASA